MNRYVLGAALAFATAVQAQGAHAAIVDLTIEFTATDFKTFVAGEGYVGDGAPYDPVSGKIGLRFDNSADIEATTEGLTIYSFDLPAVYAPKFAYSRQFDSVSFGTNVEPGGCWGGLVDFCSAIARISTSSAYMSHFGYGTALSLSVDYAIASAAVPEPATWATMIAGFGLVGAATRRRKAAANGISYG